MGTLTLSPERQSARLSKITNDGLNRSGTGCFMTVPTWKQWASKVNIYATTAVENCCTSAAATTEIYYRCTKLL